MNRTERAHRQHMRRVIRDTQTYRRIRNACRHAAEGIDLDAHCEVIARHVLHARAGRD